MAQETIVKAVQDAVEIANAFTVLYVSEHGGGSIAGTLAGTLASRPTASAAYAGFTYNATDQMPPQVYQCVAIGPSTYAWYLGAAGTTPNAIRLVIGAGTSNVELASTPPSTLGPSAEVGVGASAARSDHVHPYPTATQVGAIAVGALSNLTPVNPGTPIPGVSTQVSRADHTHAPPTPSQVGLGAVTATGSTPAQARDAINLGSAATANTGTGPTEVILGNDYRLTNSRSPTIHASTHAAGSTDPISPLSILGAGAEGDVYTTVSGVPTWVTPTSGGVSFEALANLTNVVGPTNSFHLLEAASAFADNGSNPQTLTETGAFRRARLGPRALVPGLWPPTVPGGGTTLFFDTVDLGNSPNTIAVTLIHNGETDPSGMIMKVGGHEIYWKDATHIISRIRHSGGIIWGGNPVEVDPTQPIRVLYRYSYAAGQLVINGVAAPLAFGYPNNGNGVWAMYESSGYSINDFDVWLGTRLSDADVLSDYERYAQTFVSVNRVTRVEVTLATYGTTDGSEGAVWKTVGTRNINPSLYPRGTWVFVAEGTVVGTTGKVRLYDANTDTVAVELTMTAVGPTDPGAVQSAAFTISLTTQYLVQIRVPATGSPSNSFNLTAAYYAVTAS